VPTYADAVLALARLRQRARRLDEGAELLVELLRRDPYHFGALLALGELLLEAGRVDDAGVAFARILRFDPGHPGALYYDGVVLAHRRDFGAALERWGAAGAAAPGTGWAARAARAAGSAPLPGGRAAGQPEPRWAAPDDAPSAVGTGR
jgi:tetratricopeptide (TPR) repeat protein